LFDSRSTCHFRSGFRGIFIVRLITRCDNVFLRAVLPASDAGIFIRTLDHLVPITEGFRGGMSSPTQYGQPPRRTVRRSSGESLLMARGFSGQLASVSVFFTGIRTGGDADLERHDEKVLFLKLLCLDFGPWTTLSSVRHDSSLTGAVWVPIVRRHRRKSVATPKVRR